MIKKVTKAAQIRNYVAANPKAKSADVAKVVGVTPAYVATVMWTAKKKAKVAKVEKGIDTLIPAERTERVVTSPLAVGATTLHITISTSLGAYSMKLEEAKFIYQQLNQIFGGVR